MIGLAQVGIGYKLDITIFVIYHLIGYDIRKKCRLFRHNTEIIARVRHSTHQSYTRYSPTHHFLGYSTSYSHLYKVSGGLSC